VPPDLLYDVVRNVGQYNTFVPFCIQSSILGDIKYLENANDMNFDASLTVGFSLGGLGESSYFSLPRLEEEYVSRVRTRIVKDGEGVKEWIVEARSIRSRMLDGLGSQWRLRAIDAPPSSKASQINMNEQKLWTHVDFEVELSSSDPVVSAALDEVLADVADRQVKAFEKRCIDILSRQQGYS